jgi:hypothetical protein
MSIQAKSFWPTSLIVTEVQTPYEILKTQADFLTQGSNGVLIGEVKKIQTEETIEYTMDIVVPSLGNYRHSILSCAHKVDFPYPTEVSSIAKKSYLEVIEREGKVNKNNSLNPVERLMNPQIIRSLSENEKLFLKNAAHSENELESQIQSIISSDDVKALIQSLMSRIREKRLSQFEEIGA